jgi:dynein heavy chain
MATKLRNPHYLPEVSTKVTLINFMITYEGLSDQLLGLVVEKEQPELQTKKEQLVIEGAQNKNKLQEIEDQILSTLKNSDDILGDAEGIQILENAKVVSDDINKKQVVAEKVEKEIDESRMGYQPVALRSSGLFFCISDLANCDPMYQYSLDFFKGLFTNAIMNSERSDDLEERLGNLNKEFLESLYRNICRSLFERDKLIFSMLLTIKLMELNNEISMPQLMFFLTGGVSLGEELPENPTENGWMSGKLWGELNRLCKIEGFERFLNHFLKDHAMYKAMYDRPDPQAFEVPAALAHISKFQFLLLMRVIRPDMLTIAVSDFVVFKIGEYFIQPPTFDLGLVFKDSGPATPLIFVLSPGADPLASLEKYAESKKKACFKISLGQG